MILGLAAGALVLAQSEAGSETWTFDRLDSINGYTVSLLGQPRIVETPLGKVNTLARAISHAVDAETLH